MNIKTRVKQLEKSLVVLENKKSTAIIQTPDNWADFARKTLIRSGGKIVNFDPYDYQIQLTNLMLENSVCVVKSRQLGISETIISFMLWKASKNPGYLGVVFSKTQQDTGLLARRMRRMITSLGLKTQLDNLQDIELVGGGRILFRNSKPESGRSLESVCDAFYDEASFVEDFKAIRDSLAPAMQMVGDNAREYIVSTPNGKDNAYFDLLTSGNDDKEVEQKCSAISQGLENPFQFWIDTGNWAKVIIHWKTHPVYGHNSNFLIDIHEKKKLSWETIKQEYDLNFASAEINFFDFADVKKCSVGKYEDYEKDGIYFTGIDTATMGDNYCVAVTVKLTDKGLSLVNLYRRRQESSDYHLYHIGEILDKYHPICAIETTGGVGAIYLERLAKTHPYIEMINIKTTKDTKFYMLDRLRMLLEDNKFFYPPNCPLINELLSFKKIDNKLEAATGKYDDIVMASAFAVAASDKSTG